MQISPCFFSSDIPTWLLLQNQMEVLYLMFCQKCHQTFIVEVSLGFWEASFTTVSTHIWHNSILFPNIILILLSFFEIKYYSTIILVVPVELDHLGSSKLRGDFNNPYGESSKHKFCFGGFIWKAIENLGMFYYNSIK